MGEDIASFRMISLISGHAMRKKGMYIGSYWQELGRWLAGVVFFAQSVFCFSLSCGRTLKAHQTVGVCVSSLIFGVRVLCSLVMRLWAS